TTLDHMELYASATRDLVIDHLSPPLGDQQPTSAAPRTKPTSAGGGRLARTIPAHARTDGLGISDVNNATSNPGRVQGGSHVARASMPDRALRCRGRISTFVCF